MKQLYKHNDTFYIIHRAIPIHFFTNKEGVLNMDNIKLCRDNLYGKNHGVDHVMKTESHFLFAETIEEAIILDDEQYEKQIVDFEEQEKDKFY
jgi:hypothetical protein